MSQMSDYLENKLIDHLFRSTAFTAPAGIYIALGTVAADGSFTEISGNGYARAEAGKSDAHWTATQGGVTGASSGTGGQTLNATTISFPAPTGTWASGNTISFFALYDAPAGGNMLLWGSLTVAKRVYAGDAAPIWPVSSLSVTLA